MEIPITPEFMDICKDILSRDLSEEEWSGFESDDMFQTPSFCGGFDSIEKAFCFSYYDRTGQEYWFQITLADVEGIVEGSITAIVGRLPG